LVEKHYAHGYRVNEVGLANELENIVGTDATLKIPIVEGKRSINYRYLLPGKPSLPLSPITPDRNSIYNVEQSYKKRLLRKVPPSNTALLSQFRTFVLKWCSKHVKPIIPMSFDEWLEKTSYNEQRKDQLRSARASDLYCRPSLRQCSRIKTFVKNESYPEYKHARMINSRCDSFKAWSGPIFKTIENQVYHSVPEFIKHYSVPDRAGVISAMKKSGMRYFATDFTAYESHFVPNFLLSCECLLYSHCLKYFPDDAEFLTRVISGVNRMSTRSGFRASCNGRRMSGDMCTSLGNGFANLMLVKFLAKIKHTKVSGFVEGDDGLFACNFPLEKRDYEQLGFTIKIEEISDPTTASFCGLIFSEDGDVIRDPIEFSTCFFWTQSFIGARQQIMYELLRAKALSAAYETPNCPVVGALVRYALSVTADCAARFVYDGYHEVPKDTISIKEFSPSYRTRVLMQHKFGISVSQQLELESKLLAGDLSCLQSLPFHRDHWHYSLRYVT